jgi:Tol biopolymer transport system component
MTAFDQFDLVDARIAGAIDDLAAASRPDYIDDVLKVTAARRQRPRWTFLERLLPMDTAIRRPIGLRRVPVRPLVVLLLLLLVATAAAIFVGSRSRVPAPFGPAANGQLLYVANGDIYVRDSLNATGRPIVALADVQGFPSWSPDGRWFSYITTTAGADHIMVAAADGSAPRQVATIPANGSATAAWRPDSAAMAFVYDIDGVPRLTIEFVDGSPTLQVDLGDLTPTEVSWRPPDGSELLVRIIGRGSAVDYVTVRPDGTDLHAFSLPSLLLSGTEWGVNSGAAWAPDGSRIAYNRVVESGGGPVSGTFRVHQIYADGSGDVALPAPTELRVQEAWPSFSPDGRWILTNRWTWTTGDTAGLAWLAVMPADGSAPARDIGPKVSGDPEISPAKSWSPDGTRVLLYSSAEGKGYSIDPASGTVDELDWTTALPDWQRTVR